MQPRKECAHPGAGTPSSQLLSRRAKWSQISCAQQKQGDLKRPFVVRWHFCGHKEGLVCALPLPPASSRGRIWKDQNNPLCPCLPGGEISLALSTLVPQPQWHMVLKELREGWVTRCHLPRGAQVQFRLSQRDVGKGCCQERWRIWENSSKDLPSMLRETAAGVQPALTSVWVWFWFTLLLHNVTKEVWFSSELVHL